mgnify:FL=1
MAVRNWWIEADIDGRQTTLTGGPRSKDGGFQLNLYQRVKGEIKKPYRIAAFIDRNGALRCQIIDTYLETGNTWGQGKLIHEFTSERD